jgi:hypothetical protein
MRNRKRNALVVMTALVLARLACAIVSAIAPNPSTRSPAMTYRRRLSGRLQGEVDCPNGEGLELAHGFPRFTGRWCHR